MRAAVSERIKSVGSVNGSSATADAAAATAEKAEEAAETTKRTSRRAAAKVDEAAAISVVVECDSNLLPYIETFVSGDSLEIRTELGVSMILVEHDMGLVMDIADRIVVLDFGRKIAEGTPDEIKNNSEVISAYLGKE